MLNPGHHERATRRRNNVRSRWALDANLAGLPERCADQIRDRAVDVQARPHVQAGQGAGQAAYHAAHEGQV